MVKPAKQPCERCGWKWPNFHICLNLPKEVMERVEDGRVRDSNGRIKHPDKPRAGSPMDKAKRAESQARAQRNNGDPHRVERNKKILECYVKDQMPMQTIARELMLDVKTVMNVLHAAKDRGEITIRKTARRTSTR